MPHGHCAGMPISQYTSNYRRSADGYRYNNSDLLAKSLTARIPAYVSQDDDEDEEELYCDDDNDEEDWEEEAHLPN